MTRYCTIFVAAAALSAARPARADFVITIDNASVSHGTTAVVDVMITGGVPLDFFVTDFRIAPVATERPDGLQFAGSQPDFTIDSSYVFNGVSTGNFYRTLTPGGDLEILDYTDSGLVGVDVNEARLLARLNLSALSGLTDGSQYKISIAGHTFQGPLPDSQTFEINVLGGLITIKGIPPDAVATPAPATLIAGLAGLGAAGLVRLRRRVVPGAVAAPPAVSPCIPF